MGPDAIKLVFVFSCVCVFFFFLILSFKPVFSLSSFALIKRLFSSSSFSDFRVVLSAHLRLLILLPAILIPACNSSSPVFHMMCFVYKLNKQGDNKQLCTPFSVLNQSVVPYRVLYAGRKATVRFLRTQVRWSDIPVSFNSFPICFDPHSQRL